MLETKKHEFEKLKQVYGKEIHALKDNKNEVKDRIVKTDNDKNVLETNTEDVKNKVIDPATYAVLDTAVRDIYSIAYSKNEKMGNATTLALLNELEKLIDNFLIDFKICEDID